MIYPSKWPDEDINSVTLGNNVFNSDIYSLAYLFRNKLPTPCQTLGNDRLR